MVELGVVSQSVFFMVVPTHHSEFSLGLKPQFCGHGSISKRKETVFGTPNTTWIAAQNQRKGEQ
jgi:hypothetical protein